MLRLHPAPPDSNKAVLMVVPVASGHAQTVFLHDLSLRCQYRTNGQPNYLLFFVFFFFSLVLIFIQDIVF